MTQPGPRGVKALFQRAVELPEEKRAAYLDEACGSDRRLRLRVERLLESLDGAGAFLASPTVPPEEPTRTSHDGRPSAGASVLPDGSSLGERYRIVSFAGRGGMGEVYRAEDLKLGQTVALKLLPAGLADDRQRFSRLVDEVRIARQVSHPNVCRVYDIGEADGRHFLSMEWIEGKDLGTALAQAGRLPEDRAVSIARQICAGLAAAHDCGVVHRDLKPANVMLDRRGIARITDFGLAEVGVVAEGDKAREGTPRYMSPEQIAGEEVTARSDLYALGLLLHELFTGRPAFAGASLGDRTSRPGASPPAPSTLARGIDPEVERLILRCLEADPARRPLSARTLLEELPGGKAFGEAALAAQRRADRIGAFRAELSELRRAGLLQVSQQELRAVEDHHERVLGDLVGRFDVDVTERGKQLSLGMRAVSFLGAFALAASIYYFFYRIWGLVTTPLQIGIVALAPILALLLTSLVARRERARYFTSICALVTFACLIINTSILESTFNLTPSVWAVFAWGLFALILAYGFRLRFLLVVGLVVLSAFAAAAVYQGAGGSWPHYLLRPESFFPGGLLLLAVALVRPGRQPADFPPVYCVLGIFCLIAPTAFLGMVGSLSYLRLEVRSIEILYQVLGFVMSGAAIGFGVVRRSKEAVYTGTSFFVLLLFLEFVNWWWAWMPKYLFFLIVALTALAVLFALRRLRAALMVRMVEAER